MSAASNSLNRLLIVDDERPVCEAIRHVAQHVGFEVNIATTPGDFFEAYGSFQPSAIILDLMIPEADGIELLTFLAESRCAAHILLVSGVDISIIHSAQRLGRVHGLKMNGVLQKPLTVPDLEGALKQALQQGPSITAADLRDAIDLGQITNHYQPRVILKERGDLSFEGVETFVRWQHPRYGMIMPDTIIPLAEQGNLVAPLGLYVLHQAIHQSKLWGEVGLHLSVAVKLPSQLVTMRDLPDQISAYLDGAGVARTSLILEIREHEAMADTARTMEILTRLRLKNLRLAIDNFGTGFTSLVELCHMPFNELNIDKSLSGATGRREEIRRAVRSIVGMAQILDLQVCVKGIEDQESLDFARALDCHMAQGFFLGAPMPPEGIIALARSRNAVPS